MRKFLFLGALIVLVPAMARAGTINVNPIRLDLTRSEPTAVLNVSNNTDSATVMQISVFSWKQANGKQVLTPTRALLATPPIFTVASGGTQVVRVGLRVKPDPRLETAYRLMLTQVPPKRQPGQLGLRIALRFSLPVFVAPIAGVAAPKLHWTLQRLSGSKARLTVENVGTAHGKVNALALAASPGGPALAKVDAGLGYVLPDDSLSWTVQFDSPVKQGQTLFVRGKTPSATFAKPVEEKK